MSKILIVGAGPSGLTLALTLQLHGVPYRLIDRRTALESDSKALSLNPNSLRVLDALGLTRELLASCQKTPAFGISYRNRRLTTIRFDRLATRFPFFLMQPQPETEKQLVRRLVALGGRIEWGTTLASLSRDDDGVDVRIEPPAGQASETARYRYVVACDGSRSAVRQTLGVAFTGYDYDGIYFVLGDVRIDWDGEKQCAHYFAHDDGFMVLAPLTGGYHRVVVKAAGVAPVGRGPGWDQFAALARRFGPPGFNVSDPIWLSSAPFYNRLCATNDLGNVFLVGDAAHLFSPIGGHGMNTGIGDAYNLGWKLAYVMKGLSGESLLRTYGPERHTLAADLVRQTDLSTSLVARLDRHTAIDEERLLPRMRNRGFLRRTGPASASGLGQRYASLTGLPGAVDPAAVVGGLIPYVAGLAPDGAMDTYDLMRGTKHLLLVDDPRVDWDDIIHDFADLVRVVRVADGRAFGLPPGGFALVRPDAYVEAVGAAGDAPRLVDYLSRTYHTGCVGPQLNRGKSS